MSYPPQGGHGGSAPPNNMGIAIASLVAGIMCGCGVTAIPGVFAVVQANKVQGLAVSGQHGAATEAAAKARKYAMLGFVVTAVAFVLIVGLYIALFALADNADSTALGL